MSAHRLLRLFRSSYKRIFEDWRSSGSSLGICLVSGSCLDKHACGKRWKVAQVSARVVGLGAAGHCRSGICRNLRDQIDLSRVYLGASARDSRSRADSEHMVGQTCITQIQSAFVARHSIYRISGGTARPELASRCFREKCTFPCNLRGS